MKAQNLPAETVLMPPPTLAERHEINELMRVLRAYTHPVIFNEKNPHVGTVVFLRHGERLFGFTAAHNVADDTAIHVRFVSPSGKPVFKILDTYVHPSYKPDPFSGTSTFDLAILELERTPAVTAGDVAQLYTGGFAKLPEGNYSAVSVAFVWVVGYPAALAKPGKDKTVLYQTTFATQILEHSPEQFSINYPETAYQMPQDGTTCEEGETPRTPSGYSGAGIWAINVPTGELFNPHRHLKLVGIQTHWNEKSRLARCVPSKVIADALRAFKPDLM